MKRQKLAHRYIIYGGLSLTVLGSVLLSCPFSVAAQAEDDYTTTQNSQVLTRVQSKPVLSVALSPSVTIAITPKTSGVFSSSSADLAISTNSRNGFVVLMNGLDGTDLTSQTSADKISTIPDVMTQDKFDNNTWGYYIGDSAPSGDTAFSPIPGEAKEITSTPTSTESQNYKLTFGTKVSTGLAAGTYTNTMLVSVVANPVEVSGLTDMNTMQQMSTTACNLAQTGDEKQLVDERDGKSYWVGKLKDGHCWMQQNLSLDLDVDSDGNAVAVKLDGTTTVLTSYNTNIAKGADGTVGYWNSKTGYAPQTTSSNVPKSNEPATSTAAAYSWSANSNGDILYLYPSPLNRTCSDSISSGKLSAIVSLRCPSGSAYKAITSDMSPTFVADAENPTTSISSDGKSYDAHYLIGNWYQWGAATAGTSNKATIADAVAAGSICPKGWRLPTNAEQRAMLATDGADASLIKVVATPTYAVRTGMIYPLGGELRNAGDSGYYWSSTASPDNTMYGFSFSNGGIYPQYAQSINNGFPMRCIAE